MEKCCLQYLQGRKKQAEPNQNGQPVLFIGAPRLIGVQPAAAVVRI